MNFSFEDVGEALEMIWAPGVEAWKVRQGLGVRSLADTTTALERAGYEVCYVDLPDRVSGFAKIIEGKPHIVLNRAKSAAHQQFTMSHELGHHVLHLDASRDSLSGLSFEGLAEFQAHQFATSWISPFAYEKEYGDVLCQNPEALLVVAASFLMTVAVLLVALLSYLWSSL